MPLDRVIASQRGHLFPWVPVCLAFGIAGYFALPWEPGPLAIWGVAGLVGALVCLLRHSGESLSPVVLALTLVLVGAVLAGWRTGTRGGAGAGVSLLWSA